MFFEGTAKQRFEKQIKIISALNICKYMHLSSLISSISKWLFFFYKLPINPNVSQNISIQLIVTVIYILFKNILV